MNAIPCIFADASGLAAAAGIALAVLSAAVALGPLLAVSRILRGWRKELTDTVPGGWQSQYEARWRAAIPAEGPIATAEHERLERGLRRRFYPQWNAALALGTVAFVIGLAASVVGRAESGFNGSGYLVPFLIGMALSIAVGTAVWRQYAAAGEVFEPALAKLHAFAAAEAASRQQGGKEDVQKLKDEVNAKETIIAEQKQIIDKLRRDLAPPIGKPAAAESSEPHSDFDPAPQATPGAYVEPP